MSYDNITSEDSYSIKQLNKSESILRRSVSTITKKAFIFVIIIFYDLT